ncbi:hypothetical protein [Cupriavidus malaysiensis]|uniref:Uncharacterized protein n=1 Tax=Cupriavidus malaysiensis TaxID=367825 RepID=A0ABN1N664_9BURK|nr:hypothetical protein [Cupriavidus malaysiensis]AOZ05963.1 hypothetical protein BKK80_09075 [Cupriavidus malaysiensis]
MASLFNKADWHFGAGMLRYLKAGTTPIRVATLQGIDVDISASSKELMGSRNFAEATARAGTKITGKVQAGRWDHRVVTELFFGSKDEDTSAGMVVPVDDEPAVIVADGYTVAGGAKFDMDMGVRDVATGGFLVRVAKDPKAGQYAVNEATGKYTWAAADKDKKVQISYTKIDVSRGATTLITNAEMGEVPTFELITYDQKGLFLHLYAVTFNKLSLARKNEDFVIPNMEWSAAADDVRGVGRLSGA